MKMEMLQIEQLESFEKYLHGNKNFVAGMCRKLGVTSLINEALTKDNGRQADIPYGTQAEILLVNICDDHVPLYRLRTYYQEDDLRGIFKKDISLDQLHDDRFGQFLDKFYEANPRKIFSQICTNALATYHISVKNINFDTTSKVMWGEYQSDQGKMGCISIDFGHSKDKRSDKKQLKVGMGTADGIIVDAEVLSGNEDDKTFNHNKLQQINEILKTTGTNKDTFYYIADSAAFTEKNLIYAYKNTIHLISRMPESTRLAKELIDSALENKAKMKPLILYNAHKKEVKYQLIGCETQYKGVPLKAAVCYSENLIPSKTKTIHKEAQKEKENLEKKLKNYDKRVFFCIEDAEKELLQLHKKEFKKLKYHTVEHSIQETSKRPVGRPSQKQSISCSRIEYQLQFTLCCQEDKIQKAIDQASTFVLVSTDTKLEPEEILKEYKTQSSVEKKFQHLKSPAFVNSLYLKTPSRVEALMYLILIGLMILSVCEYVVRKGMKDNNDMIRGAGDIKLTRPTLRSIMLIMEHVSYKTLVVENGHVIRRMSKVPTYAQQRILHYLGLDEQIYIG